MDRLQLFQHFHTLTDQPEAVSKLRGLVLQLAVAGRLVAHEESDTSWQREIPNERRRSIESLRLTNHPETLPLAQNELPYIMPKHWLGTRLGDLAYSCPTAYGENPSPGLRTAGVITVGNIDNAGGFKGQFSERGFALEEIDGLLAHEGDLIVVKSSGSAENVHSGKSALCREEHHRKIVGSNFVMRLRAFGKSVLPEFLWFVLTSRTSRAWVERTVQTMTYPNLKWSEYAQLPIGLPPLGEQRRIVAKVEELLALCDALEERQTTAREHRTHFVRSALNHLATAKDEPEFRKHSALILHDSSLILDSVAALRQAILSLAVQGRLLPQNPKDTPASEILESIRAERMRLEQQGTIRQVPLQVDAAPFAVPGSWKWACLAEVTELITKGSSPKWQGVAYVSKEEGVLFITSENVGNYGLRKLDELKYVEKRFNEIEPRSILRYGDILMNLVGASIGRTAVYDLRDVANINQAVALIRLTQSTPNLCAKFLLHYLNSPSAIQIMMSSQVVTAQPNISLTNAREFPIPIPPLAEQERIVAKVDELLRWCDALEARLTTAQTAAAHLLDATLDGALKGES